MAKLEIKELEKKEFKPVELTLTLNTFKELETFVARMIANPNSNFNLKAYSLDFQKPPLVHRYMFGPKSNNDINEELVKLYNERSN